MQKCKKLENQINIKKISNIILQKKLHEKIKRKF